MSLRIGESLHSFWHRLRSRPRFWLKTPPFVQPPDSPILASDAIVVAYHPTLREIGHAVLARGGNAFDAFVAVAAAQNVLAEGASTIGGPLGVLLYTARDRKVVYLDADFNDPVDAAWRWHPRVPRDGRSVLVPGAPLGLEALVSTYGSKPFGSLLEPAIRLAEEGFPVTNLMASFISWRAKILHRSEYGSRTFFRRGKPLRRGDTLRLPDLAAFLAQLARDGSPYVYSGEWGRRFIAAVRARHGVLTSEDLARYRVRWLPPWTGIYRGHTLAACSGRSYGGLWTLLALRALEHAPATNASHYTQDADALEVMVRIARAVWTERWLVDHVALDDLELVTSRLTPTHAREIWYRVNKSRSFAAQPASHSYHLIVVDAAGNVASGTTTIEADPWGEGIFVDGVPLSTAGAIPWNTAPGERRISPFSMCFAFDEQQLRFAVGAISNSAVEAAFQLLVNLIDLQLPADCAVSAPRFGTFPVTRKVDFNKNWIDPRVDKKIIQALQRRGMAFEQKGVLDTGLGSVVKIEPGQLSGSNVPIPYVAHPFDTDP